MALVGLEKVKRQVLAIKDKVEICKKQETDLKKERFNIIFQGNPGTGKTTVARLYAKFLHSVGVLESDQVKETSGSKLASKGSRGTKRMLKKMMGYYSGGVLFIDEAYQLVTSTSGRQALDILLTMMENNVGRLAVIFAGYHDDMEPLFEHNPGLLSRIPYTLQFDDFSDPELWRVLCDKIEDRLARSRKSKGFGNARSVENLLAAIAERQTTRIKVEYRKGEEPDLHYFTKEDLIGPDPTKVDFTSRAWTQLQEMIGLDSVKASIKATIEMIKRNYGRELREEKPLQVSLNQVYVGSPGTGKTTVAKLYGQILAELGLLSKGDVVLKNPSDFIGDAVGKSEAKTRGILAATVGKVLIIDEAYMLDAGSDATAGRQADPYREGVINTIVAEVQGNLGEDRCIILTGYEDRMKALFRNTNPGLARRFPIERAFRFENFDIDQLMQVMRLKMHQQDIRATDRALAVARGVLERALMRPSFSNGGEVERCLADAKSNHEARQAKRPESEQEAGTLLEAEDFDLECGRLVDDAKSSCRDILGGLVDESIIETLEEYQRLWRVAKQRGCDARKLVPTRLLFKGGPGTGKTTVARTLGRLFYNMGLLATDEVVECSVTDMIGQYVGQTAPKAREQLRKGLGKVLLIDEVHHIGGAGGYGAEALREIVAFLNNPWHRDRLVVVLIGLPKHIDLLMAVVPSLSGHFPDELLFPDLTPQACIDLLARELAHQRIIPHPDPALLLSDDERETRWDGGLKERGLKHYLHAMCRVPMWGNARDVQTLADRIARRHMLSGGIGAESAEALPLSPETVRRCAEDLLATLTGRWTASMDASMASAKGEQQVQADTFSAPQPPATSMLQDIKEEYFSDEDEDEVADVDESQDVDTQALLRQMGVCEAGYSWRREGAGWRCEGGSHYVDDTQLADFAGRQ
ncbi:putative aaa family protein [Lasiodiplodia theobromae]|nr:putative aaa family protein [Lasiodiplodia theobromae]